jgi:peptidoglycan DL-endopeptidase CwlO
MRPVTLHVPRLGARRLTALAVVALAALSLPGVAAAQSQDKRTKAAEIQDQIEATDLRISALAEKLHEAEARRNIAQQSIVDAQARIAIAKAEVAGIRELVEQNAVSLYQHSTTSNSGGVFESGDADELSRRNQYAEARAARDDRLLDQLNAAKEDLSIRRREATDARDEAAAESAAIDAAKQKLEAARAAQQAVLDQVKGEIAAEVAAERARREAAARAQFATPVTYPDVGPPNGSASQAIAWARGVKGSGYSTNPRMGPTYDCSGLTHMAWKAAGVAIPTTSSTQWAALPHVPLNAVQPGDLIFWGAGGGSHVALYVGGGNIIDASSSQGQVVERPIWGSPSGAARVV